MLYATRDKLALQLSDPAAAVARAIETHGFRWLFSIRAITSAEAHPATAPSSSPRCCARRLADGLCSSPSPRRPGRRSVRASGSRSTCWWEAKADHLHGQPVRIRGRVRSLHLGTYFEPEVRHARRRYFDMGLTAIIEAEGSVPDLPNLVMLTTKPGFRSAFTSSPVAASIRSG